MQKKVILVFLLTALSVRFYISDLVTNDSGIERRGNKIRISTKHMVSNDCKNITGLLTD